MPLTSRNKVHGKAPGGRLVHSIASGLKKSTKIFKKGGNSSKAANQNNNDDDNNNNNNNNSSNKRYGTFRHRRRRRRQQRQKESESFSSPERHHQSLLHHHHHHHPLSISSGSMGGRIQRRSRSRNERSSMHSMSMSMHSITDGEKGEGDIQSHVLRNFEFMTRMVLSYIAVYLYGVYQPFSLPILPPDEVILTLAHYLLIVWATCVLIRLMTYWATLLEKDSDSNDNDNDDDNDNDNDNDTHNDIATDHILYSDEEAGSTNHPLPLPDEDDILETAEEEPLIRSSMHDLDDTDGVPSPKSYSRKYMKQQRNGLSSWDNNNNNNNNNNQKDNNNSNHTNHTNHNNNQKDKHVESSPEKRGIDDSIDSVGSDNDIDNDIDVSQHSWSQVDRLTRSDPPQQHPELEDLFLAQHTPCSRMDPNGTPNPIDSDLFKGFVLFRFRTSDADMKEAPAETNGSASNDIVSDYFRSKKRRFEIQLQFKFKKIPDSPIFICCDLDEPIKLGLVQRAFVKATLNFFQKKNPSISYCLTGYDKVSEEERRAGRYENPHIAFPAESSLDRVVITKPGEQPPQLGDDLYEDPETMAERKKGIVYNKEDTYTFSIWSAYVDFLQWKAVNLPAIRPFSLANVNGGQPVYLKFYTMKSTTGRHLQCEMDVAYQLEIGHRQETSLGRGAKAWIEKRTQERSSFALSKDGKGMEENSAIGGYNIDTDDYDDALSSDAEGEIAVGELDEAPSDSDLDVLGGIDDGTFTKGLQNENETHNKDMMMQLHLNPDFPNVIDCRPENPQNEALTQLFYAKVKNFSIDTPAWVEMMHRKRRKIQRVYVVRMVRETHFEPLSDQDSDGKFDAEQPSSFIRLRTGKELSALVRLGLELGVHMSKGEDPKRNFDYDLARLPPINTKSAKKRGKRQGDNHAAVNKTLRRTMKRRSPSGRKTRLKSLKNTKMLVAGEMIPPDQSCYTLSQAFANLSKASKSTDQISQTLSLQVSPINVLDSWFLRGNPAELGFIPLASTKMEKICGEFIIARCLWESHWREEACLIYDNRVEFYAPLAKKPSCITSFDDVQEVRYIETSDEKDPLVLPKLAIDTHWKCHYLVFIDDDTRTNFYNILNSAIFSSAKDMKQQDEWQAHFWQGFQHMNSLPSSSGKWAKIVSSKKKYHHRLVLNNRRTSFDCEGFTDSINLTRDIMNFVEDLLRTALSFSLESLERSPDEFVKFQDRTSRLKNLPMQKLDRSSKEVYCICVNLYHCLLQHSLLLLSSEPTKKSIVPFMRTHCYEIGGDVFSLAELECCVIRGKMSSKATHSKAPFVREPKKSRAHYLYALDTIEPRINFVLNTGERSKPRQVPILSPDQMEEQLLSISKQFLKNNCSIDVSKKTIILPKICEIYRHDFSSNFRSFYLYFLEFMDDDNQMILIDLINNDHNNISIKFEPSPDRFYSSLSLLE